MQNPPFKLATATSGCCEAGHADAHVVEREDEAPPSHARARLADLDLHLHCSIIGTCLGTAELRKLMARFLFVRDSSDLEVHHEAVRMSSQGGPVAKALHKALDQRHDAAIQRFAKAHDQKALTVLWDEALRRGEIPGAYWAVLTHRGVSTDLRQKAFGDVHMLSHLVGAANRADIRRLVALERENAEMRERAERQQQRALELAEERDRTIARLQHELADAAARQAVATNFASSDVSMQDELDAAMSLVALQTERRERAEQAVGFAAEETARLRDELEHLGRHVQALNRELAAAETQLREIGESGDGATNRTLAQQLQARRVFYVGGRPSSTPAIRDLVMRHGGEFQHHDGGVEDRKGLLASGVAWAQLVVFPVDCIDHDSAGNLKRLCARHGVGFMPLRGASVASFAAALAGPAADDDGGDRSGSPGCLKHG